MKKTGIYLGAFILGMISIGLGFYVVPVYQHPLSRHIILGPLSILLTYFIFGLPPVTLYFKLLVKDRLFISLLKGTIMVISCIAVMTFFSFAIMRAIGKV
jgi:hypothetical protein